MKFMKLTNYHHSDNNIAYDIILIHIQGHFACASINLTPHPINTWNKHRSKIYVVKFILLVRFMCISS